MTEGTADVLEVSDSEPGGRHQLARLESDLRKEQARAERAERALDRVQRSASYVVGNLLVRAAKDPKKLLTLPRDLWRIWKLRRSRRTSPGVGAATSRGRRDTVLDLDAPRLLIPRTSVAPVARGSLSIAGALSHRTERAWSPYAAVSSALPHEAAALIEAVDADIVVIDTSSALPGESWEHLGNPAAVDRMRAAASLVDAAHAQGRPVVLLRTTPPSHTVFLTELAARCDLVLDGPGSSSDRPWHPGIDPRMWQVGARPRRPGVFVVPGDLAETPTAAALWVAADAALEGIARHSPDSRLHRTLALQRAIGEASFGLSSPMWVPPGRVGASEISLGLLTSGRRVVGGIDRDLTALLGRDARARGAALLVDDPRDLAAAVTQAQEPMSDGQWRAVLRCIVLAASAPVQLSALAELLDVEARPRAVWDVALVTTGEVDADQILLQSWRPREVVASSPLSERSRRLLEEEQITVTRLPGDVMRHRTRLNMAVTTPLIAHQVDLDDPDAILDLLVEHVADLPLLPRVHDSALWSTT